MAEGARLELVFTGNCNEGSNPSLSAKEKPINTDVLGFFNTAIQVLPLILPLIEILLLIQTEYFSFYLFTC